MLHLRVKQQRQMVASHFLAEHPGQVVAPPQRSVATRREAGGTVLLRVEKCGGHLHRLRRWVGQLAQPVKDRLLLDQVSSGKLRQSQGGQLAVQESYLLGKARPLLALQRRSKGSRAGTALPGRHSML